MFALIPYRAELKLAKWPFVTYAVMIVCAVIYYFQASNIDEVYEGVFEYCQSIQSPVKIPDDNLTENPRMCNYILSRLQFWYRDDWDFNQYVNNSVRWEKDEDPYRELQSIRRHYEAMQLQVPESLNKQLMYYPDVPNPVKMITSSLSHGSFWHLFFNLLFFLAFAPAIEILINNRLKFTKVMLVMMAVTSLSYSLFSLGSHPVPGLGLSGVVMGMIGMSAYMMPKARIRCVLWIVFFLRIVYIPAVLLAIWYIGWDSYDLFKDGNGGGVNLVAHVSGGISGYLLAKFWFKENREEYRDELEEEIENQRQMRKWEPFKTSNVGGTKQYADRLRQKMAERDAEAEIQKLHMAVETERDSEAIAMMLDDYELLQGSIAHYEELFDRMEQWKPSRALFCLGRLIVNIYVRRREYGNAMTVIERCQRISKDFVLASGEDLVFIVQAAVKCQKYELAYQLIKNVNNRYRGIKEMTHCRLLEIELLWLHIGEHLQAKDLMKGLLMSKPATHFDEIKTLAAKMQQQNTGA